MTRVQGYGEGGRRELGRNSRAEVDARRRKVQQLHLIAGLGPEEIARYLCVGTSTIYRDLEAIKESLRDQVAMELLWPIKKHVAMSEELMHQAGLIFLRPKEKQLKETKEGSEWVEVDDSLRKLAALDRMHKIGDSLAKLSLAYKPKPEQAESHEKTVAGFINSLPKKLKDQVVEYLDGRTRPQENT